MLKLHDLAYSDGVSMRKIISLICLLLPLTAFADVLQVKADAPERYVVVKGDTLWDISAKFFSDPWKWTLIWGYNQSSIKDPHWIYPGDIVYLDKNTNTLRIAGVSPVETAQTLPTPEASVDANTNAELIDQPVDSKVVRLSPRARVIPRDAAPIPIIPVHSINAFLSNVLVFDDTPDGTLPILSGLHGKTLLTYNDIVYVKNLPSNYSSSYRIYRPSLELRDPSSDRFLGQEFTYLGEAVVVHYEKSSFFSSKPSTLRITKAVQEIKPGDLLFPSFVVTTTSGVSADFYPRSAPPDISAKVVSIYGESYQGAQYSIVSINTGKREHIEPGHVFHLYKKGEEIESNSFFTFNTDLPDLKYGVAIVFKVFDDISYALVLESKLPVLRSDFANSLER